LVGVSIGPLNGNMVATKFQNEYKHRSESAASDRTMDGELWMESMKASQSRAGRCGPMLNSGEGALLPLHRAGLDLCVVFFWDSLPPAMALN